METKQYKAEEVTELRTGIDLSDSDGRHFSKDPAINVISKKEFEERTEKVFKLLWKTLSMSFGPYGAPTIIYNYPYSHVTKDGYTIMKNTSMDTSSTLLDQAIADMVADVCGRLNYTVGDGTTTAVISTNTIYEKYRQFKAELEKKSVMPRDVIKKYTDIKESVIGAIQSMVRPIRSADRDELAKNISDVVYVSSNGDEVVTKYISDLYKEIGFPAIICDIADDGVMRSSVISGYQMELVLLDKLYVNSDGNIMNLKDADIIIFSSKVTKNTYEKILKPLNEESAKRGRHLIVAAAAYDETALRQTIRRDLNNEYNAKKDVNMVLTTYAARSQYTRKRIEDFSILTNTLVIDKELEQSVLEQLEEGHHITQIFNIDSREIEGAKAVAYKRYEKDETTQFIPVLYTYGKDPIGEDYEPFELVEDYIRLGYVRGCSLGLTSSLFREFFYDEDKFKLMYQEAEEELRDLERKYQKLGTFNTEVSTAQQRLYSLNLKMGLIEVGADSVLSQKLIKDSVDDSIKAAASAFNNGVLKGCNINLSQAIEKVYKEARPDSVDAILISILLEGFMDVYRTILDNAFENVAFVVDNNDVDKLVESILDYSSKKFINPDTEVACEVFDDISILKEIITDLINNEKDITIHDIIIRYSMKTSRVFDVSEKVFSDKIINSAQTDQQVLIATIDLISILIVGNQMVVTQRHNFE